MQNKTLFPILLVVFLLLSVIGYFVLSKDKSSVRPEVTKLEPDQVQEQNNQTDDTSEMSLSGKIVDLLNLQKDVKCTFSSKDENIGINGTTYVSGDKIRSEFINVVEGQTISGSMISDGEWMYTWSSATPQGIKMKLDTINQPVSEEGQKPDSTEVYDQDFEYTCTNWLVDNSMFEVPSNIEFADMSKALDQLQDQCEMCDALPEDAKTACRTSLNCE